jgi:hypothetical protein
MRQVQFIVQFIAVLILLVHSIVPHHHHDELSEWEHQQEHLEASNILDYLALSLHFDHPDGQLEEFTTAQSDVTDIDHYDQISDAPVSISEITFPTTKEGKNHFYTYQADLGTFSISALTLRGPPSLL